MLNEAFWTAHSGLAYRKEPGSPTLSNCATYLGIQEKKQIQTALEAVAQGQKSLHARAASPHPLQKAFTSLPVLYHRF